MTNGNVLLRNTKIRKALNEYFKKLWEEKQETIGEIFDEIHKIIKADIHDILDFQSGKADLRNLEQVDTSIIQSINQSTSQTQHGENHHLAVKMYDKTKALDQMIKILKMIPDELRVKVTIDQVAKNKIQEIFHEQGASLEK